MVHAINKIPKEYKGPKYEKARSVFPDKERAKIQRALTQFTNERADYGISIVSNR
jgi:hypothetical protein